jgi:ribosomal silencing factor RsfS
MEYLIRNLIERLINKRNQEIKNIEMYSQNDFTDLILITSGKIMELDNIIQNLNEMLNYNIITRSTQK